MTALGTQRERTNQVNALTSEEILRYSRHLLLKEVGKAGQERLKGARVLLVGAGGLGSPAGLYLAAAGIGTIGIVDFDRVDATNLQRQLLHGTSDVGREKVESARDRLSDINPNVHLELFNERLTSANALEIARNFDIILDGSDNFPTRYLLNDTAVILGKPNIYGAIFRFEGQASVFSTPDGPCYRCLFRDPPPPDLVPNCAEAGVLGVLPGLVGTIQATEAIKLILGVGQSLAGRLLLVDALTMQFRSMEIHRDPKCPACGTREIRELIDYEQFCGVSNVATDGDEIHQIDAKDLAKRITAGEDIDIIDVREPFEWEMGRIPGARLVPLRQVEKLTGELKGDRDAILYCHSGKRSMRAAELLTDAGVRRIWNLTGGIDAWSRDVDPGIPRY